MARSDAIATPEAVAKAADAVLTSGRNPTVEAVRAELKGGSPNTVLRHLNAWRMALGERVLELERRPALPPEVSKIAQELWGQALAKAVAIEAKAQERTRVALALQAAELEDERQHIRGQVQALEVDSADLRARLELATAANVDLEKRVRRVSDARDQAQRECSTLSAYRAATEEALERSAVALEGERGRFDAEQARLLREIDAERLATRSERLARVAAEDAHAKAIRSRADIEAKLRDKLQASESKRAEFTGQVRALERQLRARSTAAKRAAPKKPSTKVAKLAKKK